MQAIFKMQDGRLIPLERGLPSDYRGIIIKGAETFSFQDASALIIHQNYQRADFAIKLSIYRFLRIVKSILEPPAFRTGATLSLRASFNGQLEADGKFRIDAEHFSFIHFAGRELLAEFQKGKEYRILDISCSEEIMEETLHYFPDLSEMFRKALFQQNASIITPPRFAGFQTLELFNNIFRSPHKEIVNEVYFRYKIRESMVLFLTESSRKETPKVLYTEQEEQQILDLKERLEQDPSGKHPIAELARELGMNMMRLKILFKKIIGCAIFEFHREQRMKEAWRLLKDEGLTTKVVASMVGYERISSFIAAFSAHHGYPPSLIQEQK
jgi:AraC-like DNA-binding protein